jgi:hypothetical protein
VMKQPTVALRAAPRRGTAYVYTMRSLSAAAGMAWADHMPPHLKS